MAGIANAFGVVVILTLGRWNTCTNGPRGAHSQSAKVVRNTVALAYLFDFRSQGKSRMRPGHIVITRARKDFLPVAPSDGGVNVASEPTVSKATD